MQMTFMFSGKLLPRDKWHVDVTSAKASGCKEWQPRKVMLNEAFFAQLEPSRADSWRGCMAYYVRGDEFAWRWDDNSYYAYVPVDHRMQLRNLTTGRDFLQLLPQ